MEVALSAVVPTLGASPLLDDCLAALRREVGDGLEAVVVLQGEAAWAPPSWVETIRAPRPLGFAGAVNRGLAATRGELVAVINDDLVVEEGWWPAVRAALAAEPEAAAVQGVNLRADAPDRIDGAGIAWNRSWQAVQLHRNEAVSVLNGSPDTPLREIFGVSATAAVYRRAALERVALDDGQVFAECLFAYYEDVELAVRLRRAGLASFLAPAAWARHGESVTGRSLGSRRLAWIRGNRYPALARLLGRELWLALPRALARDGVDLMRDLAAGRLGAVGGIVRGWLRALRLTPAFLHFGPALDPGPRGGR